jgi:hypothetical protein
MSENSNILHYRVFEKPVLQIDIGESSLIDIWQAIELVGSVRQRTDPVRPPEFLLSIANAEVSLVAAISELMHIRAGRNC